MHRSRKYGPCCKPSKTILPPRATATHWRCRSFEEHGAPRWSKLHSSSFLIGFVAPAVQSHLWDFKCHSFAPRWWKLRGPYLAENHLRHSDSVHFVDSADQSTLAQVSLSHPFLELLWTQGSHPQTSRFGNHLGCRQVWGESRGLCKLIRCLASIKSSRTSLFEISTGIERIDGSCP